MGGFGTKLWVDELKKERSNKRRVYLYIHKIKNKIGSYKMMDFVEFTKFSKYLQCFNVVLLFILTEFCSRTGCDTTQDFQKNSKYPSYYV